MGWVLWAVVMVGAAVLLWMLVRVGARRREADMRCERCGARLGAEDPEVCLGGTVLYASRGDGDDPHLWTKPVDGGSA